MEELIELVKNDYIMGEFKETLITNGLVDTKLLNEENAELRTKITELKNDLEKAKAETIWGDDNPAKLIELLKELL